MASRKKEATGISLLSMYNDEDEEMEDAESESDELDDVQEEIRMENVDLVTGDGGEDNLTISENDAEMNVEVMNDKKMSLNFVDYGHDEVAMSPEPVEEGEIDALDETGDGQKNDGTESTTVRLSSSQVSLTVTSLQILTSQMVPVDADESELNGVEGRNDTTRTDVDPLDLFLPPPPEEKCSQELQDKINKFLALKKSGKSFNKEVRNKKAYRNPDFLLHAVTYQEIDQIGSCFSKDVFDPHGYDKSDFYDEIEADMKREMERKEQERKNNQKLEFVAGGVQPGMVPAAVKPVPSPVPNLVVVGSSSLDTIPREGRQNKKSKWDKVDGDQGAHAALISANAASATAGAGYTAFAQQRRREAEEKKSSERRRSRS